MAIRTRLAQTLIILIYREKEPCLLQIFLLTRALQDRACRLMVLGAQSLSHLIVPKPAGQKTAALSFTSFNLLKKLIFNRVAHPFERVQILNINFKKKTGVTSYVS